MKLKSKNLFKTPGIHLKPSIMKAFLRIISLSVFFLFITGSFNSRAAVTITAPTLNIVTPSFPSGYNALGNIVITEGANGDFAIAASKTLVLTAPTNFEFQAGTGSVTYAGGGNISAASIVVTASTITITYTTGAVNKNDVLTISGIMVRAITTASSGTVTRTGGTGAIAGLINGTVVANLSSTLGCLHTIRLTDDIGDGWTDGTNPDGWVTVTVNGTPVLTNITLTSAEAGGPADYTFMANTGDVINITRTGSPIWPDEMKVEIIGGTGATLLATTTPVPAPGTNVTACCALLIPGLATYTAPANGLTGAPNCGLDLTWTAPTNAGCNAVASYDVYFGTAAAPPFVVNTTSTTYSTGALAVSTTYYWKIVPRNATGTAVGAVTWSFTTSATASVPGLAIYTAPANGASNIANCATLTWNAPSITGCSAPTSYDVYFGTAASPPFVVNTTALTYIPTLAFGTTYYWKIVPKNALGDAVGAVTWSFTTVSSAIYPGNVSAALPKLWFKADAGVSYSGTNATDWANQFCGSAIKLINTAGADPQYLAGSNANAINFNPVLSFDGATQYFKTLSNYNFNQVGRRVANSTNWSIESFAVTHGSGTGSLVWAWQPTDMVPAGNKVGVDCNRAYFDGYNHNGVTMEWGAGNANIINTSPLILGTSAINGQPMTDYVDLISYTSAGNVEPIDTSVSSYLTAPFAIGCLDNNGGTPDYFYNGRVCEVITYADRLNAAQRARINSYLAVKYGVTLGHNAATGGTRINYVNTGSGNIWTSAVAGDPMYNYHNDVAGVGREDNEGLHQRQSMSQNAVAAPAFQVTMGLGTIAADNISNPNNLINNAYMLWGHDGANATSWSVSVTGSALPELCRIARIWRVQETNTVGTMKVRIPNAAFGGSAPTTVYMITSPDPTFDNTDTRTAMTLGASNWDCNYDFGNGQYFTFCRECQLLPVELLSFNLNCIDDEPVLSWSTATETNNSHFVLSRSENMQSYEPVVVINGAGNSNMLTEYEYVDTEAPAEKNCYYKLAQYDFDGTETNIGVLFSDCQSSAALEIISFSSVEAGDRYLNFYTDFEGIHTVEIFNTDGQLLFRGNYNMRKGNSIIRDQSWSILKGVVVVRISTPKTSASKTFSL